MKILFHCSLPFSLAHGGQAVQIQRTMAALAEIGVDVEPLRWWDEKQEGDLIHYVGIMPVDQINFARQKKIKVVHANILTGQGSQTPWQRGARRVFRWGVEHFAPRIMAQAFGWESYRIADACIANTGWEKYLFHYKFGVRPGKIFVVPNGVEDVFFQTPPVPRNEWLVCTATITERKRVLELAGAAVIAQTPLQVLGRAYSEDDPYAKRFFSIAEKNPRYIKYAGGISDRAELARIYRSARGFVLLSTMETRSLSAEEAAASGCPLFLSDLPWARSTFGEHARYCPVNVDAAKTAGALKIFHAEAPALPPPPPPATWQQVARQLQTIYQDVIAGRVVD
ncbi:MAG TPA: glycosyltransferase family 4 protein [Candidatus Sulfotelmatobacter sp.]|nr:glycosyltransferase family 4 protein [Candidatus Sulfotelmatobacter sp.]